MLFRSEVPELLRLLDLDDALGVERALQVVEHRQEAADDLAERAVISFGALALGALAEVVELGLAARETVVSWSLRLRGSSDGSVLPGTPVSPEPVSPASPLSMRRALGEVVRRLLPVLDNLQRALDAERVVEVKESEEFRHFLHGVELINRQLGGVLEGLGVEVVPTVGERFDPHVHEAVATEETDAHEPDTVTQEMQRGYRLGDKLLRPAMVKVATRG